jgi:hypothetical protein
VLLTLRRHRMTHAHRVPACPSATSLRERVADGRCLTRSDQDETLIAAH